MFGLFENDEAKKIKTHLMNLGALAKIDGHVDSTELNFIVSIGQKNGLKPEEVKTIVANADALKFEMPKNDSDRFDQIFDLVEMMLADGIVDDNEMDFCIEMATRLGFRKSIFGLLLQIYEEFGFYKEDLLSITKKGKTGAEQIAEMMRGYRSNPIKSLGGSDVVEVLDYQLQSHKNLRTGEEKKIELEKSNVMQFVTTDGTKVSARPSGTEPKIKFYVSVNVPLKSADEFAQTEEAANAKIAGIMKEITALAEQQPAV